MLRATSLCTVGAVLLVGSVSLAAAAEPSCPELLRLLRAHVRAHEHTSRQRAVEDAVNRTWPGSDESCKAREQRQHRRQIVISTLDQIAAASCLAPSMVSSYRQLLVLDDDKRERGWCPRM